MFEKISLFILLVALFLISPSLVEAAYEDDDIITTATLTSYSSNGLGTESSLNISFTTASTMASGEAIYILFFDTDEEMNLTSTGFDFSQVVYDSDTLVNAYFDVNTSFSPIGLIRLNQDYPAGEYSFTIDPVTITTVDGGYQLGLSTDSWSSTMKVALDESYFLIGDVPDEDGDGIPDEVDDDEDNDGIPDDEEDDDNDGIPNIDDDDDDYAIPAKPNKKYFKVKKLKKRSCTLKWKSQDLADYYKIRLEKRKKKYKTLKKKKRFKKKKVFKNVSTNKKKIKKKKKILKADKTYRFKVKACNDLGCSKWSKKKRFTTKKAKK